MESRLPITVVVPIKNEAANLAQCLGALGDFARVVVVDSGSTDESVAIAEQHGADVVQFAWDGRFPKKRNWMLRNFAFGTPWVLFLDADETVTPAFVRELRAALHDTGHDGFWLRYQTYFMGRLLRHGDQLEKLALVRLGRGEYEHVAEEAWSKLDMEVHEQIGVKGTAGRIAAPIVHNDFKGLHAYYERHNHYSSWEAARYLALSKAARVEGSLTARQRLKYRLIGSTWFPLLFFVGAYGLKAGFLDGKAGFRFALGKMFYFYQVNFKVAEKKAQGEVSRKGD